MLIRKTQPRIRQATKSKKGWDNRRRPKRMLTMKGERKNLKDRNSRTLKICSLESRRRRKTTWTCRSYSRTTTQRSRLQTLRNTSTQPNHPLTLSQVSLKSVARRQPRANRLNRRKGQPRLKQEISSSRKESLFRRWRKQNKPPSWTNRLRRQERSRKRSKHRNKKKSSDAGIRL